jgi:2-desacetyl-2-hydroxyethyl bacteriochlorophyllide A dehydrogenase
MAEIESRAFWVISPGRGEIRPELLRQPTSDEVLVRTLYSGVSRGTESLVFHGLVPASEHDRMRAPFQVGAFPAPIKYGYASVGRVERGPTDLEGRVVFVLHPHQTRYIVAGSSVHVLPDAVPPARAVLAANLETAINGIWDAGVQIGDRLSVVGGGTIGCLVAWLAGGVLACDVELVDTNPARADIASALGVRFAHPERATPDVDVVIHCSGAPEGLQTALKIAGLESTIVELSWYGNRSVPLPLGEAFHSRRLTLKSSQVGRVAESQRSRWDSRRRMQLALSLLVHAELDAVITGESDFEELPQIMPKLAASAGDTLCHRIRYP